MLAIGAAQGSLKATLFETLHPDRDPIGIPIEELDPIPALIEEHEKTSVSNILIQVGLDNAKEPIETLAHIDGLRV